jgi:diguanylate cyclase (GGDEF)-like protein/PAS domain S-box-containing protein
MQGIPLNTIAEKSGISVDIVEHWQQTLIHHAQQFMLTSNAQPSDDFELKLGDMTYALDNIGAYVFIKDINGCYTYVNKLARELFHCNLEDIIGHNDSHFFSADTVANIYQNDQQVLLNGQKIEGEEVLNPNSLSERRVYATVKIPLYDNSGKVRGLCGISTDITERKQIEETLSHNQALLTTVLDNIGACIYMKSPDGRYLYVNAATALLHNIRPEQLIGLTDAKFFTVDSITNFKILDEQALSTKSKVAGMEIFHLIAQEPRYYWSVKVTLQCANGETYAILGMSTDITERKRLEDELLRLATTDELTNLNNRRHFLTLAEQTLNRSRRYREPLALCMCDIDFFKNINDTFGHTIGDQVLQQVAEIIRNTLRDTDIAGRIGGEEFAIMLVQTSLANAQEVAERLRQNIENSHIVLEDGHLVPLTISIGIAIPSYPVETLATLLQHADHALYQAKRSGRNQVCVT